MIVDRRDASSAACSSNRGIVSFFNGGTRDFAATKRISNVPSIFFQRRSAHVPKAYSDASAKIHKIGRPMLSSANKPLGKDTSFRVFNSSKNFVHFACMFGDNSSSQSTPICHSSCIPIFARIRNAVAKPIGS